MTIKDAEEAYEQIVRSLPAAEQLRLVEKIAHDLAFQPGQAPPQKRYDWREVEGIAPDLLAGEDAQHWVSRTRRESDKHREKQRKDLYHGGGHK